MVSIFWLVECCFTSTETVGLLGTGAQDGHLDFLTAPEFWWCLCARKSLMYSTPSLRRSPQRCLWDGSNVRLTDDGPLSSFQRKRNIRTLHSTLPTFYTRTSKNHIQTPCKQIPWLIFVFVCILFNININTRCCKMNSVNYVCEHLL